MDEPAADETEGDSREQREFIDEVMKLLGDQVFVAQLALIADGITERSPQYGLRTWPALYTRWPRARSQHVPRAPSQI